MDLYQSSSGNRCLSPAKTIQGLAPLADIDEQLCADFEMNHLEERRRFLQGPTRLSDMNKRALSMTKISYPATKQNFIPEPQIRRNASWSTMSVNLN